MNATATVVAGTVGVLVFLFQLWVFIRALSYPARAGEDAHVSRVLWIVLLMASFFLSFCGLVITLIFWFGPSTQIKRMQQVGHLGFPGGG